MPPEAPSFWFRRGHPGALLLAPLGWLYGLVVRARFVATTPYRSRLPVVCIGNFTMGGAGKTPLAIEVATALKKLGRRPAFLTRGFGGSLEGPHLVDPDMDDAASVGDEPLLLARHAPVVVCADRPAGARFIAGLDADVIVMDDGFQNPTLAKDLSLVVVDARRGIGNGLVFPAGPLRAGLSFQLPRADALVVAGTAGEGDVDDLLSRFAGLVMGARIEPTGDVSWLNGARLLAVAGIADPAKFHATLRENGADIVKTRDFADHHPISEAEARDILQTAKHEGLTIVLTEKDMVRLPGEGAQGELKRGARTLPIRLVVDDVGRLRNLLESLPSRR